MSKGFGIAAVIVVILSFFVPIVGFVGTGLAMVLAAIAALAGDRMFSTVTAIVGAASIFIFSPAIWITMAAPDSPAGGKTTFFVMITAVLALPFVAMFLNASGKIVFGNQIEAKNTEADT